MTAVASSVRPSSSTRTLTVAYAGGERGHGPLTMGQANMIRCILRDEPVQINIHDVWPAPPGTTVDAAIDALRCLAVRHDALRTTFPRSPGTTHREQEVAAEGSFTVTVTDHTDFTGEPAQYAEQVAQDARAERFHLDRDFPLRITLLGFDGALRFVALAASHAATDGSALAVLREEWLALLAGDPLPPVSAFTPLGLAAEEATPTGRRKSEESLRYWERVLRTGPQAMFAEPRAVGSESVQRRLTLRSLRGGRALARTAERTGALPSTVLLSAWCVLVAHRAGQTSCVAAVPTSNRFATRLARSVTTLSQDALLFLDVQVPSFDALLRKAWGAGLNAYRHSQFDSLALWEMIGSVTSERGSHFARDVVFNDISSLSATFAPVVAQRTQAPDLELDWGPEQVLPTRLLSFVHTIAPLLHLSLWTDAQLFPSAEAEGFLTGLVQLLEASAEADVPLDALTGITGVRPATRPAGWHRVDGCWVSPSAVADGLAAALGGLPVHVAAQAADSTDTSAHDPDSRTLTAFIASGDAPLTPAQAHSALMRTLSGNPGRLAPQRYVIVQDPPARTDLTSAWLSRNILMEGTGRDRTM
ncbi:condensation domain-containing protein [Streptomyces sp. RKAG290]|uniref:condensation domain-containing protein n=1 Tax=Streptomyces sp. RKAG290 TaxID=2888348 RepID=UPI0020346ED6|nr:condensation domain-containing protein [Streptomyces sp. RKAG290]MCM2415973.1 condensation domain-containing protein [Streptomyces sp. RKAG290]